MGIAHAVTRTDADYNAQNKRELGD